MLNYIIKTIPQNTQRYPTQGDYWRDKDDKHKIHIRISEMGNKDYEFLTLIHEIVEMYLCEKYRISFLKIDEFDIAFEKKRKEGDVSEPGDDPRSPYYEYHQLATGVERMLAAILKVNWWDYERRTIW